MGSRSNPGIKILLCLAMLLASPTVADARGGGGGTGGSWHGGGGGFGHGGDFGGRGYGYGGFGFYGYPYWGYGGWDDPDYFDYYAYPYGYPYAEAPTAAPPAAQSYWYFCRATNAYYPYVRSCPGGWQKVSPSPRQSG